jgi:hypothetical protein
MFDFTTAATTVGESAGTVTATIRLTTRDGLSTRNPSAISFGTANGSALAGSDYTAASSTFTFPVGTASGTTRTAVVPIVNDTVFETLEETFTISLSSALNAGIGAGSHAVTIRDDEPEAGGFLDAPPAGGVVRGRFLVGGWAIDRRATSGVGIDVVDVYARPGPGFAAPGIFLGRATVQGQRPDVAAQHGPQFLNSGYGFFSPLLPPGTTYDVVAHLHVVSNGSWVTLAPNRITVESGQVLSIDSPAAGTLPRQLFTVAGWAANVDAAPGTGTGVDQVSVVAQPLPSGTPVALGTATYGAARPDVAAIYGAQFQNSGYSLTVATLPAGQYRLDVTGRTTVPGAANPTRSVTITVPTDPVVTIDAPANNSTTGQPFLLGGWAIDRAAASGTGVSTVHVWATLHGGGGGSIFLGVPVFGPRPDVAAAFGAQFMNSGYTLPSVAGLSPGTWTIGVFAMSTVTGTFNGTASTTITIPTPNALVVIDAPGENATVGQAFHIGGWAVDRASPNTVGISALHVWAHPWSGAPPILLGAPLVGSPRPDVAAYLGAAYYTNSGWGLNVTGALAPGTYTIAVHPVSTGNVIVPGAATRVITVQ